MTAAIRIQNVSKRYRINHAVPQSASRYRTLREALTSGVVQSLGRLTGRRSDGQYADFWALRDISFDVEPGDVVGIIGRNGAGKTTLLKILTRITDPTLGRAEMRGRVGSLLEVGTGFHPELTGRENVFLNGSILGMRRTEIRRHFDEIVAFSGVETFLDTPVKRYSSGMRVRLAFSVAAHLNPEILLIDEVLAVGDAEFQRKCLGKMSDVARAGRTVLFVSHNMAAVEGLCTRGVFLSAGRVEFIGSQAEAIRRYCDHLEKTVEYGQYRRSESEPPGEASIVEAVVTSQGSYFASGYAIGAPLEIVVHASAATPLEQPGLGIGIDDSLGRRILTLHTTYAPRPEWPPIVTGRFTLRCRLEALNLAPGDYRLKLSLENRLGSVDVVDPALTFTVLPSDFYNNGGKFGRGLILCRHDWQLET